MNDYESNSEDVQQAIHMVETAYDNAVDDEDQAEIQEAIDILTRVKERMEAKV